MHHRCPKSSPKVPSKFTHDAPFRKNRAVILLGCKTDASHFVTKCSVNVMKCYVLLRFVDSIKKMGVILLECKK